MSLLPAMEKVPRMVWLSSRMFLSARQLFMGPRIKHSSANLFGMSRGYVAATVQWPSRQHYQGKQEICSSVVPFFTPGAMQPCRNYAKGANKKKEKSKGKGKQPKTSLSQEELTEVIDTLEMKRKMEATIAHLQKDFVEQLSLRTSQGALDNLSVNTPDGDYPLIQIGQVIQKNPQLIMIDMTALPQYTSSVKKAIENSGMNLNPQQEGSSLYVPIPKVTREYRERLSKNAKTLCDKTKETLRHIQNHYVKELQKAKRGHSASETLLQNLDEHVHFITKEFTAQAETLTKQKQTELLDTK